MKKVASVSSKGQVVIPKSIRDLYSFGPKSKVVFELIGERVVLKPFDLTFSRSLKTKLTNFGVDLRFRKDWEEALKKKTKGW